MHMCNVCVYVCMLHAHVYQCMYVCMLYAHVYVCVCLLCAHVYVMYVSIMYIIYTCVLHVHALLYHSPLSPSRHDLPLNLVFSFLFFFQLGWQLNVEVTRGAS